MRIKTFLHGERGDQRRVGEGAGLTGEEALDSFSRTLYEVAFDLDVDESTGESTIVAVNGMSLLADAPAKQLVGRVRTTLQAANMPSGPFFERSDVIDVVAPIVTDLVSRVVAEERRRIGAMLRTEIDEYDETHDDNGLVSGVEGIAGVLEEGGDPDATTNGGEDDERSDDDR